MKKLIIALIIITFSLSLIAKKPKQPEKVDVWQYKFGENCTTMDALSVLGFHDMVQSDLEDLVKLHGFIVEQEGVYVSKDGSFKIYAGNTNSTSPDKIDVDKTEVMINRPEDLAFLGLDRQMSYNDLVAKYGYQCTVNSDVKNYNSYQLTCEAFKYTHRTEHFYIVFNLSDTGNPATNQITSMVFIPWIHKSFLFGKGIFPINTGCLAGDCATGTGFYQFADGSWVLGKVVDGIVKEGTPGEYLAYEYVDSKILANKLADPNYKTTYRQGFLEKFFSKQGEYKNLVELFGYNDFNDGVKEELVKKCQFSQSDNIFTSPDNKVQIEFSEYAGYINSMTFQINDVSDLLKFGIDKQKSKDDLTKAIGHEYNNPDITTFNGIYMSGTDMNKEHHIIIGFRLDPAGKNITTIKVTPVIPGKAMVNGDLHPIKSGVVSTNAAKGTGIVQYIDGYRYEGSFIDGYPLTGKVYAYTKTDQEEFKINFAVGLGGSLPFFMTKDLANFNPFEKNIFDAMVLVDATYNSAEVCMMYVKDIQTGQGDLADKKKWLNNYADSGIKWASQAMGKIKNAINLLDASNKSCEEEKQSLYKYSGTLTSIIDIFNLIKQVGASDGEATSEESQQANSIDDKVNTINLKSVEQSIESKGIFKE